MVRQALVVCVMAPPIHLGAWSMAIELLTLGAHAQRGLQYLCVSLSVCLSVCYRSSSYKVRFSLQPTASTALF